MQQPRSQIDGHASSNAKAPLLMAPPPALLHPSRAKVPMRCPIFRRSVRIAPGTDGHAVLARAILGARAMGNPRATCLRGNRFCRRSMLSDAVPLLSCQQYLSSACAGACSRSVRQQRARARDGTRPHAALQQCSAPATDAEHLQTRTGNLACAASTSQSHATASLPMRLYKHGCMPRPMVARKLART